MANTISSLVVALGLDIADFQSGLKDVEAESQSMASRINSGLSGIGAGVAGGIVAAGAAAAGFLATTVGPASDLNETVSKVGVVFGSAGNQVIKFGMQAANSMGMSENAALSAAGTYGNLFRAMGITETASADMSMGLVKLAGDLASFNNMNPTEVMDALRSGLSGETEPLKRLGVNINQATVEAKALNMHLWDGVAPLSAAAKAQATYALVMEQTKLAQGDFERTSGGVANQARILAANFEDIKAKIGAGLLPMLSALSVTLVELFSSSAFQTGLQIFTQAVTDFANIVIQSIPIAIDYFNQFVDWLNNNQGVVVAVLAVLGTALLVFAANMVAAGISAAAGFIAAFWPVILVIGLIGLAAYLLYEAWQGNWGGIRDYTAQFWAWLEPILTKIVDWFQVNIPLALQAVKDFWNNVMLPALGTVVDWLKVNIPVAIQYLIDRWNDFVGVLGKVKDYMDAHIFPLFKALYDLFNLMMIPVIGGFKAAWEVLGPVIGLFVDLYIKSLRTELELLWKFLGEFGNYIAGVLADDFAVITEIIDRMTEGVVGLVNALGNVFFPGGGGSNGRVMPGYPVWSSNNLNVAGATVGADVPGGSGGVTVVYNDNAVVGSANEYEIADKIGGAVAVKLRQLGLMP